MKATVIVPAYNEERRIKGVLEPICNTSLVREVIVVNDGSTDKTAEVARQYNVSLVEMPKNMGKAEAIKQGLRQNTSGIILLLDADLIGLKSSHIADLILPLQKDDIDMTIGIFESGRWITDLAQKIAPNLSGQRGFKRELIGEIERLDMDRYNIEVAMSRLIKNKKLMTKKVLLKEMSHVTKEEKLGLCGGLHWRVKMYKDIIRYWIH
ncbi:glycosyl transferase, family 2 [Alkaliphilus metalliredigens QYMF]|uniref:Glucosyl-3-phosphoglycerate synthase n=1 Tax=Alkaliphilus metalliredigens (strain QYMF) TaxID=293826 RepID=A6TRL3_ALKMQ|nr:glycosyltransferase family 2 protein [Alkaliphilus metalliredigens]ABR48831.1 glycosyl transferase, family 2 [Alkaliphilus metalliredigens QYMF]